MFARKVGFVFKKKYSKKTNTVKFLNPGEKIFFKIYKKNKKYREEGVIEKHVSRILCMVKGLR